MDERIAEPWPLGDCNGGSSGVRTQDQRVKSPVLYQLS